MREPSAESTELILLSVINTHTHKHKHTRHRFGNMLYTQFCQCKVFADTPIFHSNSPKIRWLRCHPKLAIQSHLLFFLILFHISHSTQSITTLLCVAFFKIDLFISVCWFERQFVNKPISWKSLWHSRTNVCKKISLKFISGVIFGEKLRDDR